MLPTRPFLLIFQLIQECFGLRFLCDAVSFLTLSLCHAFFLYLVYIILNHILLFPLRIFRFDCFLHIKNLSELSLIEIPIYAVFLQQL